MTFIQSITDIYGNILSFLEKQRKYPENSMPNPLIRNRFIGIAVYYINVKHEDIVRNVRVVGEHVAVIQEIYDIPDPLVSYKLIRVIAIFLKKIWA